MESEREVESMTLGEKLQRLRKARGMSQEELAARMGVSRQAVSRWELNIALPDTEECGAAERAVRGDHGLPAERAGGGRKPVPGAGDTSFQRQILRPAAGRRHSAGPLSCCGLLVMGILSSIPAHRQFITTDGSVAAEGLIAWSARPRFDVAAGPVPPGGACEMCICL